MVTEELEDQAGGPRQGAQACRAAGEHQAQRLARRERQALQVPEVRVPRADGLSGRVAGWR
eukprot:5231338-Pyramimonas_sp.AAC.1